MKMARVVGKATLSRMHPAMQAAPLRCVEIVDHIDRLETQPLGGDMIVAWDLCGCGEGDLVALAEGPESAAPFKPELKPLDASIVAILDHCEVSPTN